MVLVLCLNAAADKTLVLRRLRAGRMNPVERALTLPGGKGINVARALRAMGERPLVLGFTAGYTGDFIADELRAEGIPARWVRLASGESRTCLSLLHGGAAPTEANEPGPRVAPAELERLERLYLELAGRSRLVILSGSMPLGCPAGTYGRMIRAARRLAKPVLLDTSLGALAPALEAGPQLVKLNADEALSLGLPLAGAGWERRAIDGALRRGSGSAAITLGADGAVASLDGKLLRARSPRVAAATPVGCGDTFLAGLAAGRLRGWPAEQTLAYATAVATASAMVLGAGVFRRKDVPAVLRGVKVSRI